MSVDSHDFFWKNLQITTLNGCKGKTWDRGDCLFESHLVIIFTDGTFLRVEAANGRRYEDKVLSFSRPLHPWEANKVGLISHQSYHDWKTARLDLRYRSLEEQERAEYDRLKAKFETSS